MRTMYFTVFVALMVYSGTPYAQESTNTATGDRMRIIGEAQWLHNFQDLSSMVETAEAIVLVDWVDASLGRQFLLADGTAVPFTLNTFSVRRVLKGSLSDGAQITLEQTGGQTSDLVASIDDGGPYTSGRYLLFLSQQSTTGFYVLLHPQGRYKILRNRLMAVDRDGVVSRQLNQRDVAEIVGRIGQLRGSD